MPIRVKCQCGKTLSVPDAAAGQKGKCPACGAIVDVPLFSEDAEQQPVLRTPLSQPVPPPVRPFIEEVALAFRYPVRGAWMFLLPIGALLFTFCVMFGIGVLTWIFPFIAYAYFAAYFLTIVQDSAGGSGKMPELPGLDDIVDDLLKPVVHMFAAAVASLLPQIIYLSLAWYELVAIDSRVLIVMSVWTAIYFPMAVMSVAIWRSVVAVSPHVVIPTILRIPAQHVFMTFMVWVISQGYGYARTHMIPSRTESFIGGIGALYLSSLLLLYFSFVIARVIGITHHIYHNRIGWFPDRD